MAQKKTPQGGDGHQWNEASFLAALHRDSVDGAVPIGRALFDWAGERGLEVWYGKGNKQATMAVGLSDAAGKRRAVLTCYSPGGVVLQFDNLKRLPPFDDPVARAEFRARLGRIGGVDGDALADTWPTVKWETLLPEASLRTFLEASAWVVERIRTTQSFEQEVDGDAQEGAFERLWLSLIGWVQGQGEWTTLEGVRVTFIDATEERIRFQSMKAGAYERTFPRKSAQRAIEQLQREGQGRWPTFELAPAALLARLPNIEYGPDLRTLHWMDGPTHELGTVKMHDSEEPGGPPPPPPREVSTIIRAAVAATGLWFDPWVVDDVYLSLRTKPLLLLTGLSGTGKTKVAQALQDVLCDDETRAFVSVRPDWTDSRSLLGYHNLLTDRFHATDVTRFLMDAAAEWDDRGPAARPYLLILDEMNLARVEHYFSDFLSVLESRRVGADGTVTSEPIRLHGATTPLPTAEDEGASIPPTVTLTPNVYVIGTVNVDETTHPFSRKVLDRAMTIELFDVDLRGRSSDAVRPSDDERAHVRRHFTRDGRFVDIAEPALDERWITELVSINDALAPYRLHVGYRVRNEVLAFVQGAGEGGLLGDGMTAHVRALDLAITQKILPRLAGSQERLWKPLVAVLDRLLAPTARRQGRARSLADDPAALYRDLEGILGGDGWRAVEEAGDEIGDDIAPDSDDAGILSGSVHDDEDEGDGVAKATRTPLSAAEVRYPRAARKVARMLLQLRDEGYTSFFE